MRVEQPPTLGVRADAAWRQATFTTDFIQKDPQQGHPATLRMEGAFVHDGDALDVGARVFSDSSVKEVPLHLSPGAPPTRGLGTDTRPGPPSRGWACNRVQMTLRKCCKYTKQEGEPMVIGYMKAAPTTYVMQFEGGKVVREGPGLSFFYWKPAATLVSVPLSSADVPFAFNEVTRDFQAVTLQGQLTYRVADPKRLASLLDYSVGASGQFRSDDPEKLQERLVQVAQVRARTVVQGMPLREVLVHADTIEAQVLAALAVAEPVRGLGVEVMAFSLLSVKPTPEMARALEAEAREGLQRSADEAIYARRNAAVEQERRIKESELATELAVEARQRQIREAKMAADISVEEQRSALMERWSQNERQAADARAYSLEKTLAPVRGMDWKTLMATSAGGADPALNIALAFREMAENAQRIGELNVSPDLLHSLMGAPGGGGGGGQKPARPAQVHKLAGPRER